VCAPGAKPDGADQVPFLHNQRFETPVSNATVDGTERSLLSVVLNTPSLSPVAIVASVVFRVISVDT
jgi:hypothetical protein